MNNAKIELKGVDNIKNGKNILKGINLAFISGRRYSLVGPSGGGKTTLLRLLNRLDEPSSGAIYYDGKDIKKTPVLELRRRVGMVFQIPVVFSGTVKDNLLLPYRLGVISKDAIEVKIERNLQLAGLEIEYVNQEAQDLSVGQKQRLNIARALMNEPEVLLLDEPTGALDPTAAKHLITSIIELNERLGLTVIMVTHQLEGAKLFGGRVILLVDGQIVEEEETDVFFSNPRTAVGRAFIMGELK